MRQVGGAITLAIALSLGSLPPASVAKAAGVDLGSYYAARLGVGPAVGPSSEQGLPELSGAKQPVLLALANVPKVPSTQLSEIRGGFELPGGVTVNFGFTSSTFLTLLQNKDAPLSSIVQTFTVNGVASGSSLNGSVTQEANGVTNTAPIGSVPLEQIAQANCTAANNCATSVLTSLTGGGLTTLIKNSASNELIQHTQTLNLDVSGLRQQMLSHLPSFGMLSSGLLQANRFNHR